jgi:hypothetical protein
MARLMGSFRQTTDTVSERLSSGPPIRGTAHIAERGSLDPPPYPSRIQRWLKSVFPVAILVTAAVVFSSYKTSNRGGSIFDDGTHLYAAPLAFSRNVNPYHIWELERFFYSVNSNDIRHWPREFYFKTRGDEYLSTPINLLLYLPFVWLKDFELYMRSYFALYFLGFAGSFYLLTWARGATAWRQALSSVIGTALLFPLSSVLSLSVNSGQIEYLYVFPTALGIFLYRQSQENGRWIPAALAGAAFALSGEIKLFPFAVGLTLVMGAAKNYISGPAKGTLRCPLPVSAISLFISSVLLVLATCLYTGFQTLANWYQQMRAVSVPIFYGTRSLGSYVGRLHSIWTTAPLDRHSYGASALIVAAAATIGWLGFKFALYGRRKFSELELVGLICLWPSLLPNFHAYYLPVLVIPFLTAWPRLTQLMANRSKWKRLTAFGTLTVIFCFTQAVFRVPEFLQVFDPALVPLRNGRNILRLHDLMAYPSTLMLFAFIWWLRNAVANLEHDPAPEMPASHPRRLNSSFAGRS